MQFLAPAALIAALLAIPILLLYMLRLRRREIIVSSTLLWQQLLRDREANAPWQRLRRNLLLFLQLLLLAALVVALMRPFVEVPILTSGRIALLVDASASMNATDIDGGRFAAARARALELVSAIRPEDSVAVVRVAGGPELLENYTNDTNRLREAINGMQPGIGSANWDAALALAAAGAQGAEKFTIVIVGDGGLPDNLDLTVYGDVRLIPVGNSAANIALAALAVAADPIKGAQLYAQIANYGAADTTVLFSLYLDGAFYTSNTYTVPAGNSTDVLITNLSANFTRVQAMIAPDSAAGIPDHLTLDDTAWAVYTPARAGRAVILSTGNPFLEQGFASLGTWQVFQGDPSRGVPAEPFDLYVFDNWIPPILPAGNILFVNPPEGNHGLFLVGKLSTATGNAVVRPDDLRTRYLRWNDVNVLRFRPVEAPWAEPLVTVAGGALILAGEYQGQRVGVITFDLYDSDLPLKIAYPILLANLTAWYESPRTIQIEGSLRPGQTVSIAPLPSSDTVRLTRPDGTTQEYSTNNPPIIAAGTEQTGLYTVESLRGGQVIQAEAFAVNLFDEGESRITPRTPKTGVGDIAAAGGGEVGQQEFWGWLALAALGVLMVEWFVHHRRLGVPRTRPAGSRRFARGG